MSEHTATETTTSQVFRLEGDYWTIAFAATTLRLRDTVGLRYLAHLLRQPHRSLAAFELIQETRSAGRPAEEGGDRLPDAAARERARVNVARTLGGALRRIASHHPALGAHLGATVRTGNVCSYTPDPRLPTSWEDPAPSYDSATS